MGLLSDTNSFFELKEKAKWSNSIQERKAAVSELSAFGEKTVPLLEEIMNVTAYEEIRAACMEAIKAAKKSNDGAEGRSGEEKVVVQEPKLADLPS